MNLQEMKALIPNHTVGTFATYANGRSDLRGWQLQFIEDDKVYFCTSNLKNVYRQMQENPNVAFMCHAKDYTFRLSGKANFVTDLNVIQKVYDHTDESVQSIYKYINDNGFTVFYLTDLEAKYAKGFSAAEIVKL